MLEKLLQRINSKSSPSNEDDEDEEDNDLLGEVEDEEDDVSGIIDPGISKDES